jgi:hypothetical protein
VRWCSAAKGLAPLNESEESVRKLQNLLYELIAEPSNAKGADGQFFHDVRLIIRSNQHLGALERINICADAYFYRLLECLKEARKMLPESP